MNTKTTYAGVTTELNDNLFEKPRSIKTSRENQISLEQ